MGIKKAYLDKISLSSEKYYQKFEQNFHNKNMVLVQYICSRLFIW